MDATATILVVDDEANIRFFLEDLLARDGHQAAMSKRDKRSGSEI